MKSRNSSFELLRILCIFSILGMHSMNRILALPLEQDMATITFAQSVFNISSSCLMMLAGFFGIKFSIKKFLNIEGMLLFWSLLLLGQRMLEGISIGRQELLASFLPFLSSSNWFVTGYLCIMLFSKYINMIPDKLSKKDLEKLLFMLMLIFYVCPTLFYFDITGANGKDVIHLFIVYLTGRYIAKYDCVSRAKVGKWILRFGVIILLMFGLNIIAEFLGMRFWFARDCSLLTLAAAVCCVIIFSKYHFSSKVINFFAGNILSVILCETFITKILTKTKIGGILLPDVNFGEPIYYLKLAVWCLGIMITGILAEKIRFKIFGRAEAFIAEIIQKTALRFDVTGNRE